MKTKFKVGACVELKSGGPVMTVSTIIDDPVMLETDEPVYSTQWFDNKKLLTGSFVESSLVAHTPPTSLGVICG